jgi:signal transduction histidine kinase
MIRDGRLSKKAAPLLHKFRSALAIYFFVSTSFAAPQSPPDEVLTNANQVLSLPVELASNNFKVIVTGVVTAAEPNWNGKFFVQDSSGGIFADNGNAPQPKVGDFVEVTGISHPGAFAPIIGKPQWRKLGTAPLPPPKIVPIEQLMSGSEDSQRVEAEGVVREAAIEGARLRMTLANAGYRLRTYIPVSAGLDPDNLIGSRVRVRGTAAASFNAEIRHLITMIVYIPDTSDFVVEEPEEYDPFTEPILSLDNIARYHKDAAPDERIHVKGVVTYQRDGLDFFLKDKTGGLRVKTLKPQNFALGDTVEAAGFPGLENFLPVLQDASFIKTAAPPTPVIPESYPVEKLQTATHQATHHADYITLDGTLLDRNLRPFREAREGLLWVRTVLLLQSSNFYFTAEAETPVANVQLEAIPIGSQIRVRGVCIAETADDGKFKSLQILLPTPESFTILRQPSWLTPQRLGIALAILFIVSMVAVSWIIMISRKNSELNVQIREKEEAQGQLQEAHDQLEVRVKERTEQLKVSIAARKESELQFKGVIAERTRLAQELHDTLEQALASIALQLDISAKLLPKDVEAANYHFEMGRNILAQSQVDVRRSVWDLRSRALEQFNLRGALANSSRQIVEGTNITVELKTSGVVRPLPEIIEENVLRIMQEALTNTIKHSGATRADISLEFTPQYVTLQISDNGSGFAPADHPGPREGHFGLLGISERAQRLGGKASITGNPGSGTTVRAEIPTELSSEVQWAAAVEFNGA